MTKGVAYQRPFEIVERAETGNGEACSATEDRDMTLLDLLEDSSHKPLEGFLCGRMKVENTSKYLAGVKLSQVMSKTKDKVRPLKEPEPDLHYREVEVQIIQYLTGKILTVIDSAIIDPQQNKAVKDLIKNHIRDEMCKLQASASHYDNDGKDTQSWGHSIDFPGE